MGKKERTDFSCVKISEQNPGFIEEFPVTLECEFLKTTEDGNVIGKIVNVSIDEKVLNGEDKIDMTKFKPIAYEPTNSTYHVLGEVVGQAFRDGKKLS